MKAIRTVLACLRKADNTFNLINHGDKIVVGLSGGKDSIVLTYCLSLYKKFSHTDFEIQPVVLDLGFPGFDPTILENFCQSLGLNLIVSNNKEVYPILKQKQGNNKHLPCSICSRMKKAAINKVAKQLNFNKVAFAHHADDAIETLFMNEIFGAKIGTFSPKMHLEKADITFIRPLLLVRENDIKSLIRENKLPVMDSICPSDKQTCREEIKSLLSHIYRHYPFAKENFLTMISNYQQFDLWGDELSYSINQKGLSLRPVISKEDTQTMMDIRFRVFVEEQHVPYDQEYVKDKEKEFISFLILKNNEPVGTINYHLEGERDIYIGRLAIYKQYRGNHYGEDAFSFLVEYIKSIYTPCSIFIHAQLYISFLYERHGFLKIGEPFMEAGIPHILMKKTC